jgi:hypothetical protein
MNSNWRKMPSGVQYVIFPFLTSRYQPPIQEISLDRSIGEGHQKFDSWLFNFTFGLLKVSVRNMALPDSWSATQVQFSIPLPSASSDLHISVLSARMSTLLVDCFVENGSLVDFGGHSIGRFRESVASVIVCFI